MDSITKIITNRLTGSRLEGLGQLSEDEGYALQAEVNRHLAQQLGAPSGYKIGATTEAMRQLLRVEQPIAGEVFASTVHASPAQLQHSDFVSPGIETEIAVRLARDVPVADTVWKRETIAPFVAALMPAIEIVDNRYADFPTAGAATFAADNNFNAGSILGKECTHWQDLPLDRLEARTFINGKLVATARSDQLMGHPLDALCWLANRYNALGRPLRAGHFVSLGTITPVQWIPEPCNARTEIDHLGTVEVTLVQNTR